MAVRLCAVISKSIFSIVVVFTLCLSIASAQQLDIAFDDAVISVPGTSFSKSAGKPPATGLLPTIFDLPLEGTLTTPTFTFTFDAPGAGGTVGIFDVGIVLDELSSSRQLEMFIPGMELSFIPGGGLSGSLGVSLLNIYARDAQGTTSSSTVSSADSVAFTDTTLAFSAASQIAAIKTQGGAIADIVSNIHNSGLSYNYKIIIKEFSAEGYTIGTDSGGFASFPTVSGDAFSISNIPANVADSASLDGGYVLSGTLTIASQANQDLTLTLAAIDIQSTEAEADMEAALDIALNFVATSAAALGDGAVTSTDQVNNLLDSLTIVSAAIRTAGDVVQAGHRPDQTKVLAVIIALKETIVALDEAISGATTKLTAAQAAQLSRVTVETLNGLADTLVESTSVEENALSQETVSDLLLATTAVDNNFSLDLFSAARRVIAKRIPEYVLDSPDCEADEAVNKQGQCVPNSVAQGVQLDSDLSASLGISKAETTVSATGFGGLGSITPGGIAGQVLSSLVLQVSETGDAETPAQVLDKVLETEDSVVGPSQIEFTSETSSVIRLTPVVQSNLSPIVSEITLPAVGSIADSQAAIEEGASIYVYVSDIVLLPESVADGSAYLSNGSILLSRNGIGIVLVPASVDVLAFADGLDALGGTHVFMPDYSLRISAGGTNISASFGFEEVANSSDAVSGNVGFTLNGSGDESNLNYVLSIEYADGRTQALQPYAAAGGIIDSILDLGFSATVHRATGVINIAGIGDFRPSYLVTPSSASDVSFLASNGDIHGVAYRVLDANGDGVTDLQVVSAEGVQIIYGL